MVYSEDTLFTLNSRETRDKHLISTKSIEASKAVLTEEVLVFGPNRDLKRAICLGCGVYVDCSTICHDCGWPVCSSHCDKLTLHRANECKIFKKCPNMSYQRFSDKFKFHQYDCILPLRILLLKEKDLNKWKSIEELNYNMEIRRDSTAWHDEELYVVKFIRQKCKLKRFNEELIHKVCSIIDANCYEISNSKNNLRCIYHKSHFFSHSCVPNCAFAILPNENFRIFIKAAVDIDAGEKLTCSKVKPIKPTLLRRQQLLHSNYISCQCRRCADATELQSNFSTLKCTKCKTGDVLAINPLDFESDWKCAKCRYQKKYRSLKLLYNEIERELNKVTEHSDNNAKIDIYDKLLKKYSSKFHSNHAFIVYMKYNYLQLCLNGDTFHISNTENIAKKIQWLEEILDVFDITSPGCTIVRGSTLHMLCKAFVIKAKKCNTADPDEKQQFNKYMTKALRYLDMAEEIMVVEKPFSASD